MKKVLETYKYKEFEIKLLKTTDKKFYQVFFEGELYSQMHFAKPKSAINPINAVSKIKGFKKMIKI